MFAFLSPPYLLSILIALSVHEWAHGYVAYVLGDYTAKDAGRLTLNPLSHLDPLGTILFLTVGFGWGKPVPVNSLHFRHPKRDTALVSLAGPVSNFALAFVAFLGLVFVAPHVISADPEQLLGSAGRGGTLALLFTQTLETSVFINLGLMAFNLLPIAPLDGSKILAAYIPIRYEDQYDQLMRYGPYILLALLILGRSGSGGLLAFWVMGIARLALQLMMAVTGRL